MPSWLDRDIAIKSALGIGDEVFAVREDDVVYIPAGVPHFYQVEGAEPFEFLCIVPNAVDKIEVLEEGN